MDDFVCDYACTTVGEGIIKYEIPDDWCAEFEVYDVAFPIYCFQVDLLRKTPPMMALKLRMIEDPDKEYAGCMVCKAQKTIAFKIDRIRDLLNAIV